MNIEATKLELMNLLLNTQKESVLEKIKDIFRQEGSQDWWEELSKEEHQDIEVGLKDAENGQVKSHRDVMKLFDEWK
ncbi:hypothetical protein SAMN05660493_01271 [Epilithonimonas bovis DSM 19482]|uniref:Addiction module component n=1 Tax=Epilithonimonas bovis DSM 19482 TaxID=1121284 RepID=A0A1U7PX81_9FLAO|nr:hypothetical protein [Epilithonimonas bovis]SIT96583.1 hypothetical protein SAMN05660493_01271 [Epilithonimonas bovis DSM 19482]